LELQCDRCWTPFKSREEFEVHDGAISSANACRRTDKPTGDMDKMSERQYSKVINRVRSRAGGYEKWQAIYRILFPSDPLLSPCKSQHSSDGEMLIISDWRYTGDRSSGDVANPDDIAIPTETRVSIGNGAFNPAIQPLAPGSSQRPIHQERYDVLPLDSHETKTQ
jgi:hypothetical protein